MVVSCGFNEYHDSLMAGARRVAKRAREMAEATGVRLDDVRWHRGHEVADLDNYYLTLIAGDRSVSRPVPNEWLERAVDSGAIGEMSAFIGNMLNKLQR